MIHISLPNIEKTILKNKYTIVISLLLVLNLVQFVYFQHENRRLNDKFEYSDKVLRKDVTGTREAVKQLSTYFEDKGNTNNEGLVATIIRLENAIQTYDGNVDIYNSYFDKLFSADQHLQSQINDIKDKQNQILSLLRQLR